MGWSTLSGRLKNREDPRKASEFSEPSRLPSGYSADDDNRLNVRGPTRTGRSLRRPQQATSGQPNADTGGHLAQASGDGAADVYGYMQHDPETGDGRRGAVPADIAESPPPSARGRGQPSAPQQSPNLSMPHSGDKPAGRAERQDARSPALSPEPPPGSGGRPRRKKRKEGDDDDDP